jgi:hypothetical protein
MMEVRPVPPCYQMRAQELCIVSCSVVDRFTNLVESKGVTRFALVDHSGEADRVGMKMPPAKALSFGSPSFV